MSLHAFSSRVSLAKLKLSVDPISIDNLSQEDSIKNDMQKEDSDFEALSKLASNYKKTSKPLSSFRSKYLNLHDPEVENVSDFESSHWSKFQLGYGKDEQISEHIFSSDGRS